MRNIDLDTVLGVAEGLDLVLLSQDEVLVQFGTRSYPSELLRDPEMKGILGQIVRALLDGPQELSSLLSNLRQDDIAGARVMITDLVQRGVLTDVRSSPVEQYLDYIFSGDSTLTSRSISIIGAGPLGARLAYGLLQHGMGQVVLLDDRKADSVWRTFLPFDSDGTRDTEGYAHIVLRDRLLATGHSEIEALDVKLDAAGVEMAVGKSDFTVVAFEQPNLHIAHLVNRLCISGRKPWMLASIDGSFGLVGPLFLPTHTACYNCYRTLADAASASQEITRKYRQHILERGTGSFFPGLPAFAEIVAGYASLAILHFLLRKASFALGRVLMLNFDRMLIDVEDVLKLPRCPACGIERSVYRPPFSPDIVNPS